MVSRERDKHSNSLPYDKFNLRTCALAGNCRHHADPKWNIDAIFIEDFGNFQIRSALGFF